MNDSQTQKNKLDFIKEQYSQYHQIRRHVNSFSWQIPSIAVLAILFFIGLDAKNVTLWSSKPIIPAFGFLVIGLFIFVLLVFHIRNITFLRNFENVLSKMENEFGISKKVYAHQLKQDFKWWQNVKSSILLGFFIASLLLLSVIISIVFWVKVFTV